MQNLNFNLVLLQTDMCGCGYRFVWFIIRADTVVCSTVADASHFIYKKDLKINKYLNFQQINIIA